MCAMLILILCMQYAIIMSEILMSYEIQGIYGRNVMIHFIESKLEVSTVVLLKTLWGWPRWSSALHIGFWARGPWV